MKRSLVPIALLSIVFTSVAPLPSVTAQPAADVKQLEARVHEMRRLMDRVRNTADPAERQRLMDEHMRAMHDGMAMMGRMMGGSRGGTACGGERRRNDDECQMREMQRRQGMMDERLDMMQMLMEQMMDQMAMRGVGNNDGPRAGERRQDRADRQPREERK